MNTKRLANAIVALIVTTASTLAALPSTATTTPTLGTGAGQVSIRVGIPSGSPGNRNVQLLVGGTPYTWPGQQTQVGDFIRANISYSVNSEPHSTTLYAGARPSSIGGSDIPLTPNMPTSADFTFTPPAGSTNLVVCWSFRYVISQNDTPLFTVCSDNDTRRATGSNAQRTNAASPIKYSGPEFSSLFQKPVLNGTGTTLEGRKLDQISSITIDGKAAKLSEATDKSLKLELPAGLKPGVYDLVVTTANHGKLTHMNAIRIREELPPASLTIKGTGVLSGEEFKKLTAFSRTQNPDMNTVTCIVNSNSEGKSFMQARALCDRIAANNLNVKTTMFEARSTVEGSAIFARVVFSSDE